MNSVLQRVYEIGIIPVIAFNSVDEALPRCKALMQTEGMRKVSEIQSYFVRRLETIVRETGKSCAAWNEVLEDNRPDKSTLISELTIDEARALIGDGFIGGGMLPKLNNCIDAIENGVSRVHILDGRIAHCLLLEIFTNRGIGTAILSEKEKRYYNE